MVPVKQPIETIDHYVQELNDATSLMAGTASTSTVTAWYTIIFSAVGTFLRVFIGKGFFSKGIDGFVVARLASIYSLVKHIKLWEYQMRRREEGSIHRLTSEDDLGNIKEKHSV